MRTILLPEWLSRLMIYRLYYRHLAEDNLAQC